MNIQLDIDEHATSGMVVQVVLVSEDGSIDYDLTETLALGPGLMNAYGVYEEEYSRLYDNKDGGHYSSALGVPVIFIGVIQIFIANTLRPIGSRTMHKLGPGPCVFVGGIIMSIGLLSASYSQHIWELCLTQGVVFGVGVCLVWVSAASAPSSWFIKNCSMVTGITHMGLGIGGFVYSQLTRYFLEKSGTGGSLRWLSLTTLVGATVVSLGIHNRHYEQPCQNDKNKPAIPSVRWSRFLEDQVEKLPELDHDSDADFDDCENTPSIAHKKANATLDKLESLARDDSPLDRRRRTAIYSQNLHRHSSQARAPQTDVILSDNVVFDLATTPCDADAKTRTGVMVRFATIARNWRLCLFVLGTGVGQVGWYLLLLLITSISVSVGLDVHNAAMILGTINAASAVGRFAAGYAADMVGPTNALLLFTVLATASSAILFISSLGFHLLVTYGCLCGASIGAADPLASMAAVTQFGTPRAITTISMIYGSIGVFVAILAPNARVVIERLGSGGTNFAPFYVFIQQQQQQQHAHQASSYYSQRAGHDYNRAPSGYEPKYASGEYSQDGGVAAYHYGGTHGSQSALPASGYYGSAKYEYAPDDVAGGAGTTGTVAANGEYYQQMQAGEVVHANAHTPQQAAYYHSRGTSSSYYQPPAGYYQRHYSQAPATGTYTTAEYADTSGYAGLETGIAMPPPAGSPRQYGSTSSHMQNGTPVSTAHGGVAWSEYYQQQQQQQQQQQPLSSSAQYYSGASRYPQKTVAGTPIAAHQQYAGGGEYYDQGGYYSNPSARDAVADRSGVIVGGPAAATAPYHHRQPGANGTRNDVYRYQ
ncbi:hypothetical protein LPJ74_003940 [Coemansia sp. RSA 1843]|nr:hypothetical protein LPJ74_003940 [Coemansia sp. RSA 1843]